MARQTRAQKAAVECVMHAFKQGELEQRASEPVKTPQQAIAIALHEAGASNQEDPKTNERNLARTRRKERAGKTAKTRAGRRGSLDHFLGLGPASPTLTR